MIRLISQHRKTTNVREFAFQPEDVVELVQEPLVNVGHLMNLLDAVSPVEGGGNSKYAFVSGVDQLFVNVLHKFVLNTNR